MKQRSNVYKTSPAFLWLHLFFFTTSSFISTGTSQLYVLQIHLIKAACPPYSLAKEPFVCQSLQYTCVYIILTIRIYCRCDWAGILHLHIHYMYVPNAHKYLHTLMSAYQLPPPPLQHMQGNGECGSACKRSRDM